MPPLLRPGVQGRQAQQRRPVCASASAFRNEDSDQGVGSPPRAKLWTGLHAGWAGGQGNLRPRGSASLRLRVPGGLGVRSPCPHWPLSLTVPPRQTLPRPPVSGSPSQVPLRSTWNTFSRCRHQAFLESLIRLVCVMSLARGCKGSPGLSHGSESGTDLKGLEPDHTVETGLGQHRPMATGGSAGNLTLENFRNAFLGIPNCFVLHAGTWNM